MKIKIQFEIKKSLNIDLFQKLILLIKNFEVILKSF